MMKEMNMSDSNQHPNYVIPPPSQPALPVRESDQLFPVRRVYCVGRNYADHAIEMGHNPNREKPFFFQKNPDNLLFGQDFPYPPLSNDVHHEVELVIALKDGGNAIPVNESLAKIYGYGIAIDFTRRDLQAVAKKSGKPWATAKAFEHSAPISEIVPIALAPHPTQGRITLKKNGEVQQDGNLNQMIWTIPEIISELSQQFTLAAGDIILTGTPAGVGPVMRGDQIQCSIEDIADLSLNVI